MTVDTGAHIEADSFDDTREVKVRSLGGSMREPRLGICLEGGGRRYDL